MNNNSNDLKSGKLVGDSKFFIMAYDMLNEEINKLVSFTECLDKDPHRKKQFIAEYKCARYRCASVSRIYNFLWHGNRVYSQNAIHVDIENGIKSNTTLEALCNNAPDSERIDYKLYYGISFIAEEMINVYSKRLSNSGDWEKIELEERIGGLKFAQECLNQAWEKRKEVIK